MSVTTVLASAVDWSVAVAATILVILVARRLWFSGGAKRIWVAFLSLLIIQITLYFVKAAELATDPAGYGFVIQWGVGRRWGDISHWLLWTLISTGFVICFAASVLGVRIRPHMQWAYVIGVALACAGYLVLCWVGDRGQTFFFPRPWSDAVKWLQLLEGLLLLWVVSASQAIVLMGLEVVLEAINRWKSHPQTLFAFIPLFLFAVGGALYYTLFHVWPSSLPGIKGLVTQQMPGYVQEFDSPQPELVVYQLLGMVVMPLVIAAIAGFLPPPSAPPLLALSTPPSAPPSTPSSPAPSTPPSEPPATPPLPAPSTPPSEPPSTPPLPAPSTPPSEPPSTPPSPAPSTPRSETPSTPTLPAPSTPPSAPASSAPTPDSSASSLPSSGPMP